MHVIIFVINLSLRFIFPFGRVSEDFLRERTLCMGVLYASPFHSLSLYPLHLSLSPSLSLLSIILFGLSNGSFPPCYHMYIKILPRFCS